MKTFLPWIVAILLVVGGVYSAYTKIVTKELVSCSSIIPRPVIVAFGDSLVAGYGAAEGEGFVDVLSTTTRTPIRNSGVVGNTTADGVQRIQDVLDQKPDIVLVLLGGNDALREIPLAQTSANLASLVKTFSDKGIKIVLLAAPGGLFNDPYAPVYDSIAKKYFAESVPNVLSGLLGHSEFMSDAVHPNSKGYRKVADKVLPALNRACNEYFQDKTTPH